LKFWETQMVFGGKEAFEGGIVRLW